MGPKVYINTVLFNVKCISVVDASDTKKCFNYNINGTSEHEVLS